MTEYLVVGDVHGDINFAYRATQAAANRGITKILQVGDFGIWDHLWDGVKFLDSLEKAAANEGVRWYFLPGNHENYDRLEWYEEAAATVGGYTDNFIRVRSNIWYTGKVNQWEWDGRRFTAVGGAYSIDKMYRVEGSSWWPQEEVNEKDFDKVLSLPITDILLTHDCPSWAVFGRRLKEDPVSAAHRRKMDRVYETLWPRLWVHGHYHSWMDYKSPNDYTQCYGLECNDSAMWGSHPPFKNMFILNADNYSIRFV